MACLDKNGESDLSDSDCEQPISVDTSDDNVSDANSVTRYVSSSEDEDTTEEFRHRWYKMDTGPVSYDPAIPRFPFIGTPGINFPINDEMTALDFLNVIFADDILDVICKETNRYAAQNTLKNWSDTTIEELRLLFALQIHQGIVRLPKEEMHWSRDPLFEMPFTRNVMSYKRFRILKQALHFGNNETYDANTHPNPKLNKIYEVYCMLQNKFRNLYTPERDVAIDESLKRSRFGIKHFMLCESSSGYVSDFVIYVGKGTQFNPEYDNLDNMSARVVMTLMKPLLNKGYCVTTDNNYTSPNLAELLITERTDTFGTVRMNRKNMPFPIKQASNLKKGEIMAYRKDKTMALRWKDKKDVNLLSTIHNAETKEVVSWKGTSIKPVVVCDYNVTMGEVDRDDQHLSDYPISRKRTKKYYKKLFFHMFDMAVWNSYLLYKKSGNQELSPLQFRLNLVRESVERYRPELRRPSSFKNPTRFTPGHFPEEIPPTSKKRIQTRRCVLCSKRDSEGNIKRKETRYQCNKCNESLCLIPCFKKYHTP